MKVVVALSFVQFVLLCVLVGMVGVLDRDLKNVTAGGALQPSSSAARQLSDGFTKADIGSIEMQLREVIREELAAQLAMWPAAADGSDSPQTVAYQTDPVDQARDQEQFESVTQKIDYYESLGSISAYQMQKLQSEIVTLNAADRKEAFRLLMRAMSSGALEGQL